MEVVDRRVEHPVIVPSPPEDSVREEVTQRVLRNLLDDAERCEGELDRADVNRAYVRRNLNGVECAWVERRLIEHSVTIIEALEDDEADDVAISVALGQTGLRLGPKRYLSEAEERELGRQIQLASRLIAEGGSGDKDYDARVRKNADLARCQLVETNLRYVWKVARAKGQRQHMGTDDLFQEGVIGLMRATNSYDPELGFRFKTYATWWMQQSISRAIANDDRTVRLPVHLQEQIRRIRRSESKLAWALGRPPTMAEVANYVGADTDRLAKLLWRVHATNCLDADAPIGEDYTLLSTKADDAEGADDVVNSHELRASVSALLLTLTPREERVLRMRFGLDRDRDHTLEAVGQTFGVTRERIRQIEAKGLRKLKHPTRSRKLREFVS